MASGIRVGLDEVIAHFSELEDPRSTINRLHPLPSVMVIAVLAVLAGSSGPTAIAEWAEFKKDLLLAHLSLPHGIPSKDVFRRVLMALNPGAFQACFTNWLQSLRTAAAEADEITKPVMAIDGKTLRRSHDKKKGLGALHSVTAWMSEYGLCLGQVATEEKSNEITAIPLALALVDLQGAIITIDAMGTQTAIAQQVVDGKGDYILALKGNQGTLFKGACEYIDEQCLNDFEGIGAERLETHSQGHGRSEIRTYIQMPVPKALPGAERWPGILTLGVAVLYCIRNGKETSEARFFISSLAMNVKQFAHSVRSHWGIENSCHWCLNVTYREDESRIREKHLRENFAWLNRFTLSLLKQHPGQDSIAMKRRCCGWSDVYMLEVLIPK